MMEENNEIFLAGYDALVYLAGPMHKKIFHNICLGPFILYVRILGPNKHIETVICSKSAASEPELYCKITPMCKCS